MGNIFGNLISEINNTFELFGREIHSVQDYFMLYLGLTSILQVGTVFCVHLIFQRADLQL